MLGAVEVPLLLIGEVFYDKEEEGDAREYEIGDLKCLSAREARQKEEVVGGCREEQQHQGLDQGDEDDVENEENESVVDL